jgi:hypothetical protein
MTNAAAMMTDVTTMTIRELTTEYWALLSECVTPANPATEARLYDLRIEIAKRD